MSAIHPGKSLGWITLGASLHGTLSRLKAQPDTYPQIDLSYSSSDPITQPVIINLPTNGLRLRFDGPDQRLRLIEVLDFSKTNLQYKGTELVRPRTKGSEDVRHVETSEGPPFRHIYNRLFGPAYAGEYVPPDSGHGTGTYVLSYPGLAFSFPLRHSAWSEKADFVTLLSSSAAASARSMAIFSGPSWPEARASLFTKTPSLPRFTPLASKADAIPDEIECMIIHGGGRIEAIRRSSPAFEIILSETTPQDLIAELGPPDAVYRKHDNRISIHANNHSKRNPSVSPLRAPTVDTDQSPNQSTTEDSESDAPDTTDAQSTSIECFYNYFHHGFDALISYPTSRSPSFPGTSPFPSQPSSSSPRHLVVTKLILHANIPGSYSFNRHRRSRWVINTSSQQLTSEQSFSSISPVLKSLWHSTYSSAEEEAKMQRGMVLNRGWGESPESSIELLGGFEQAPKRQESGSRGQNGDAVANMSNTELFGFPGLLFEVLKNDWISCLTVY